MLIDPPEYSQKIIEQFIFWCKINNIDTSKSIHKNINLLNEDELRFWLSIFFITIFNISMSKINALTEENLQRLIKEIK